MDAVGGPSLADIEEAFALNPFGVLWTQTDVQITLDCAVIRFNGYVNALGILKTKLRYIDNQNQTSHP